MGRSSGVALLGSRATVSVGAAGQRTRAAAHNGDPSAARTGCTGGSGPRGGARTGSSGCTTQWKPRRPAGAAAACSPARGRNWGDGEGEGEGGGGAGAACLLGGVARADEALVRLRGQRQLARGAEGGLRREGGAGGEVGGVGLGVVAGALEASHHAHAPHLARVKPEWRSSSGSGLGARLRGRAGGAVRLSLSAARCAPRAERVCCDGGGGKPLLLVVWLCTAYMARGGFKFRICFQRCCKKKRGDQT